MNLVRIALDEAYNLDRGPVGIDLEFLLRRDLRKKFKEFIAPIGFKVTSDGSVHTTHTTMAELYVPREVLTTHPMMASNLLPLLGKVLAWLKHVDNEHIDAFDKFGFSVPKMVDRQLKLPRGRVPLNMTAGLHLHFDADTWFNDIRHVARFIKLVKETQDEIKARVIPGRYTTGKRELKPSDPMGQRFAKFPTQGDVDDVEDVDNDPNNRQDYSLVPLRPTKAMAASGLDTEKYSAVNLDNMVHRGDVEIRFMHATLNIETITMWLKMIVSMIEHSRESIDHKWNDLRKSIDQEEPEINQRMDVTRDRMTKSGNYRQTWDPYNVVPRRTKAVKRILGNIEPVFGGQVSDF